MANKRPVLSLMAVRHYNHEGRNSDTQEDDSVEATSSSGGYSDEGSEGSPTSESESDCSSESSYLNSESSAHHDTETSFYKSAHWTQDGTTIIASSYDNQISSFLIPEDLLQPRAQPLTLNPYNTLKLAEPTNIIASAPYFDIRYANTDHFLVAPRDHPLHLHQALPPKDNSDDDDKNYASTNNHQPPVSSYPLISHTTEAYLPIHSVAWPKPGTHFYTGTRDLIAEFDITRPGPPSNRIPTIPSRRHIRKGNGVGMKGVVSALGVQPDNNLLAAGTWTRWIGLYDISRSGECIATWSIADAVANAGLDISPPAQRGERYRKLAALNGTGGAGLTQTTWSPCGRYLLLNERQSTGLLVYDVRVTNKLLCFLAGRDARTHQRLECDVFRGLDAVGGFEVWAGSQDGTVQVWEGVGNSEGSQWPSWEFSAVDGTDVRPATNDGKAPAVGSLGLHCSGSVVVTCSGGWSVSDDEDEDMRVGGGRKIEASSLKLWRIGSEGEGQSDMEVEHSLDKPGDGMSEAATGPNDDTNEIEKARLRVASALRSMLEETDSIADAGLEENKGSAAEQDTNSRAQDHDIDIPMET